MNLKNDPQFRKISTMLDFVTKKENLTAVPKSQKAIDRKVQKQAKSYQYSTLNKNSKKIKKIRKISFHTSRTGKNLFKLRKTQVLKIKRLNFLEEERRVFTHGHQLLNKTISQKNDNDIDSEPEIILMGVKYLHSKLVQSIHKEQEIFQKKQKLQKARRLQSKKKSKKLPEYFTNKQHNFNTPSDRRISVNDRAYLSSIMTSQIQSAARRFKVNTSQCTVKSNASYLLDSKNKTSSRFWIGSKQKNSMMTMNTDFPCQGNSSRKGSGAFANETLLRDSIGSMFFGSPNVKKA